MRERDVVHAGATRVARRQPDAPRAPRAAPGPAGRRRAATPRWRRSIGSTRGDDRLLGGAPGDELAHAVDGDRRLLAAGEHAPDHPRQEAEPAEVGDEQGQRLDVERARRQRPGADEQHEPEPDVGGALAERHHALVEHAVAHGRAPAVVDEAAQPGEHGVGRVVDLDRRGRRHDVADETGDGRRGLAVVGPVPLDAPVERLRREHDADERDQQHGRAERRRPSRAGTRRRR